MQSFHCLQLQYCCKYSAPQETRCFMLNLENHWAQLRGCEFSYFPAVVLSPLAEEAMKSATDDCTIVAVLFSPAVTIFYDMHVTLQHTA